MKKNKNILWAVVAAALPTALLMAQATASFESNESFSAQSFDMNSPCVTCSEVSGTVGQISGEVMPAQVAGGELAGTVSAQPVYTGGGGGGFVPVTQQYATPTGTGGGYEMGTTSTTTMPMTGMPNTGLGDSSTSYLLLLGLLLILGEVALLGYKRFKKI
jgi:LPXTG-motif cell wall-anchored protein